MIERGFQFNEGARFEGIWVLLYGAMLVVRAMTLAITHSRGGPWMESASHSRMRANAVSDGARCHLRASGEGDVAGQAPGVIYNK